MRRAAATFSSHSFTLGGTLVAQRHRRGARRRRRRVHAERPVSRRRRAPGRQPHDDRSRQAALPEPRGLQGHPRRHGARGVQRQDHRPAATRRRPTRSRPTTRCCCPTTRTINTKPQLEIFADDVKCTHGAAIGQLDEDAMFYLRARGLTYLEARDMLIHAFAGEILDRVKIEPLRRGARRRALRAAGPGSRGGRRGMTPVAAHTRDLPVLDVAQVRADFPILRRQVARQAARLPRQRGDDAEAAGRDRRDRALLHRRTTPTSIAACTSSASVATRGLRKCPRARSRAFFNAPQLARDRLHAQRDREHQPGRARVRADATSAPATKCSSRRWSTTRTSCRGSCSARSAARGCGSRRSTIAAS